MCCSTSCAGGAPTKSTSPSRGADPPRRGAPDIATNQDCSHRSRSSCLPTLHWRLAAALAGCAVGPAYERPPMVSLRPPGRKRPPLPAGDPPHRPMPSTAASGGSSSATPGSTIWPSACRSPTRTLPTAVANYAQAQALVREAACVAVPHGRRCRRSAGGRGISGAAHAPPAAALGADWAAGPVAGPACARAVGSAQAQRTGERGRPGGGAPVGAWATSPPTTSRCARPMPNSRMPGRHARGLPAQPTDHAQPLRRRHRRPERRAAGRRRS